ncbi:MAG: tetratricopeptide repeat protein [Myxococcota bacterium]|nr:tetratricopeptide repeat protein [Myxococcota bacterium]
MTPERSAALAGAERAIVEGRWDEARETLDDLARAIPVEEPAPAARLDLALRTAGIDGVRRIDGALPPDVVSAAAALEGRPSLGHRSCVLLASVAIAEGRLDEASRLLAKALDAMPWDDRSRMRRMFLDLERGDTAGAALAGRELLRRFPRCPEILFATGRSLLAEGLVEDAAALLARLVELRPTDAEARALLGAAGLALRRFGDAVEHLRVAVAVEPTPDRAAILGLGLVLAGRPAEALDVLERAVAEHPGHAPCWNNYGVALAAAGRLPEARDALLRALAIDRGSPAARANLADVEALMGSGR